MIPWESPLLPKKRITKSKKVCVWTLRFKGKQHPVYATSCLNVATHKPMENELCGGCRKPIKIKVKK